MKAFVSWSGGKDSCLACYRALKNGVDISFLLTMLDEKGLRSKSHGLKKKILEAQAKAVEKPIIYKETSWENYEEKFKEAIKQLKKFGVEAGVFGDLRLLEHKKWVENVCNEVGIKALEPLWNENYKKIIDEFFSYGFEAIIISVKSNLISEEWLGQSFNEKFIEYLKSINVDLLGENGEYHTLVTYGPIFKKRVEIIKSKKNQINNYNILNIIKVNLK
jgi:uncharacterized protein (TIGR00290 family)